VSVHQIIYNFDVPFFANLLVLHQVLSHPYLCRFDEEHSVFLRDTTLAMFEDNMQVPDTRDINQATSSWRSLWNVNSILCLPFD
jgi:hypothetical protein